MKEGAICVQIWGRLVLAEETRRCKGPMTGLRCDGAWRVGEEAER